MSDENKVLEIEPGNQNVRVNVGYQTVELCKLYGPLVFADIRVRAEWKTCEWVIERLPIDSTDQWVEVARIPGQLDEEFKDHT